MIQSMKDIWEFLQDQIALSQTRMETFANQRRKAAPRYQVGDQVWLSTRNIKTQRPSKKLDPYKILEHHRQPCTMQEGKQVTAVNGSRYFLQG
jgi:hypothetical protein